MKLSIHEIRNMKGDINGFADIIHNHFLYLSQRPELQHNVYEIRRLLSGNDTISFVVYDNDKIIAYLIGEIKHLNDGRTAYYVSYLYVCQKYRNKKIGTKLMKIVINKAKESDIRYVILTCDTNDKKVYEFYQKLGFMPDHILRNYGRHEVMTLYL